MVKNDKVILNIDGYSSAGDGVAHHEGRAVFVKRALRGERVNALILKANSSAVHAKVDALLEPSPERIASDCPYYPRCGGCATRHMTYAEELRYKHERVSDALKRLGGVEFTLPEVVAAPSVDAYRNKAIFEVSVRGGVATVGFYREHSHDIVAIERCAIQSDAANTVAAVFREWVRVGNAPNNCVHGLFVRDGDGGVQVALVTTHKKLINIQNFVDMLRDALAVPLSVATITQKTPSNVALSGDLRMVFGSEILEDTLCGLRFRLSPRSFYQVNRTQAARIYAEAIGLAALDHGDIALDLYCGAGTIALTLAKLAPETVRIIGAEIVADAVENARENAKLNNITNVEFMLGDVADAAASLAAQGVSPTVVIVDPPRKGLAAGVIATIAAMAPERVVYVSCDPATLARDVKVFVASGYAVKTARAFDMFPRCAHVETVLLLSKLKSSKSIEVKIDLGEVDLTKSESKATYDEIKAYVLKQAGLKVSQLYITQVKRKHGIIERENYYTDEGKAKVPQVPEDKEKAIEDTLRYFQMI